MSYKFKLNLKSIFKIIYLVIILANIITMYYVYSFFNTNILQTLSPVDNLTGVPTAKNNEDININKFNEIIKNIESKNKR